MFIKFIKKKKKKRPLTVQNSSLFKILQKLQSLLSAHLFQLLGVKMRVCLKAGQKLPFGEVEMQLLYKSCVLDEGINTQDNNGPLEVHKQKVKCTFEWYPLGSTEKY